MKIKISVVDGRGNQGTLTSHDADWRTARSIMARQGCSKLEMTDARDNLRAGSKVMLAIAGAANYIEFAPAAE